VAHRRSSAFPSVLSPPPQAPPFQLLPIRRLPGSGRYFLVALCPRRTFEFQAFAPPLLLFCAFLLFFFFGEFFFCFVFFFFRFAVFSGFLCCRVLFCCSYIFFPVLGCCGFFFVVFCGVLFWWCFLLLFLVFMCFLCIFCVWCFAFFPFYGYIPFLRAVRSENQLLPILFLSLLFSSESISCFFSPCACRASRVSLCALLGLLLVGLLPRPSIRFAFKQISKRVDPTPHLSTIGHGIFFSPDCAATPL